MSRCSLLDVLSAAVNMCYSIVMFVFIAIIESNAVMHLGACVRFKDVLEKF